MCMYSQSMYLVVPTFQTPTLKQLKKEKSYKKNESKPVDQFFFSFFLPLFFGTRANQYKKTAMKTLKMIKAHRMP